MITDKVARFIAEIDSKDIPEEAYKIASMAIIDLIGVALAGSKEETGNIIAIVSGRWGQRHHPV